MWKAGGGHGIPLKRTMCAIATPYPWLRRTLHNVAGDTRLLLSPSNVAIQATLKSQPEDFRVTEIGLHGRKADDSSNNDAATTNWRDIAHREALSVMKRKNQRGFIMPRRPSIRLLRAMLGDTAFDELLTFRHGVADLYDAFEQSPDSKLILVLPPGLSLGTEARIRLYAAFSVVFPYLSLERFDAGKAAELYPGQACVVCEPSSSFLEQDHDGNTALSSDADSETENEGTQGRPGPPSDNDGNDEWEGDAKEASPPAMGFVVQFDRTLAPMQHLIPRNDIKLLHYYMKCHNKLPGLRDGVILMRGHSDSALDAALEQLRTKYPFLSCAKLHCVVEGRVFQGFQVRGDSSDAKWEQREGYGKGLLVVFHWHATKSWKLLRRRKWEGASSTWQVPPGVGPWVGTHGWIEGEDEYWPYKGVIAGSEASRYDHDALPSDIDNASSKKAIDDNVLANTKVLAEFVLEKRGLEHMDATALAASVCRVPPSTLQYAGIKDKHAVTRQWVSTRLPYHRVTRIDGTHVEATDKAGGGDGDGETQVSPYISISRVGPASKSLSVGALMGNEFQIRLRNAFFRHRHPQGLERRTAALQQLFGMPTLPTMVPNEQDMALSSYPAELLQRWTELLRSRGFINYYGTQRVGSHHDPFASQAVSVGRALWQNDLPGAIDALVEGRKGVQALDARQYWKNTRDAAGTLKLLPPSATRERTFLQAAAEFGLHDPAVVLKALPRSVPLYFAAAYSSALWNQVASLRIAMLGADVVPGDLVVPGISTAAFLEQHPHIPSVRQYIHVATQSDIDQGAFTIHDVVLPVMGNRMVLPENSLAEEYIRHLPWESMLETLHSSSGGGSGNSPQAMLPMCTFRPLVVKPWGVAASLEHDGDYDDHDNSNPYDRFTVDVALTLPRGSFATEALHELLKCDSLTPQQQRHRDEEEEWLQLERESTQL